MSFVTCSGYARHVGGTSCIVLMLGKFVLLLGFFLASLELLASVRAHGAKKLRSLAQLTHSKPSTGKRSSTPYLIFQIPSIPSDRSH